MDDFFTKFKDFFDKVKDITNVRFAYMKELYNLGLEQFPNNYEILNIQKNNQASIQQGANKFKKNWTDDDKKVLIWLVGKYLALHKRDFKQISESDWINISSMMQRREPFHCKQKWLQMLRLPLQQAPWTRQEDDALLLIIQEYQKLNKGNKWSQIATSLNKRTDSSVHRNGKQCRERWNNHLNPTINRKPWQLSEDLELMKLAILNGKKWAQISKQLKLQRSENNVKNRFNCLMRKEKNNKVQTQSNQESNNEEQDSFLSDPSVEELSLEELRCINAIIKKIEWRIKQDGGDPYDVKQEDFDQQSKKITSTRYPKHIKQQQQLEEPLKNNDEILIKNKDNHSQSDENLNNDKKKQQEINKQQQNTLPLQIMDFAQISSEESLQLQTCLVNKEKNKIYFINQEQVNQFFKNMQQANLNKDAAVNQGLYGLLSNTSLPSYNNLLSNMLLNQNLEDPLQQQNQISLPENQPSISSYFPFFQFNNYQSQYQGASQSVTSRSVLNFPPNLNTHNYQQVPNYHPGYNYHLACYPQQSFNQHLQNSDKTQV
ncbi:unnamed protein product [Paramecium octaurelia]|uniref:Homeodomain protein n=1 Tax=Paramecium octaurelia TaxID=43137 RepID=A0A8S1VM75_PAROT|nr:unnamed protein product [Paramecium octaurelia]